MSRENAGAVLSGYPDLATAISEDPSPKPCKQAPKDISNVTWSATVLLRCMGFSGAIDYRLQLQSGSSLQLINAQF